MEKRPNELCPCGNANCAYNIFDFPKAPEIPPSMVGLWGQKCPAWGIRSCVSNKLPRCRCGYDDCVSISSGVVDELRPSPVDQEGEKKMLSWLKDTNEEVWSIYTGKKRVG